MIWRGKRSEFKVGQRYWRPFFCLRPRIVEEYRVWLEYVEAERYLHSGEFFPWGPPSNFRLTDLQKKKVGIVW